MSEDTELASALREQASALRQANQIKATELSYNDAKSAKRDVEQSRANKINLMIQAINTAIKLKADRPIDEAIADAEKLIEWFHERSRAVEENDGGAE